MEMKSSKLSFWMGVFLLFSMLVGMAIPAQAVRAAGITVCASECDYATVQDAINAASEGDTINIAAETFNIGSTITVNKGVTLLGPDGGGAVLQGTNSAAVSILEITSSNVILQNLEITHAALTPGLPSPWNELSNSLVRIPSGVGMSGIVITGNTIYVPAQSGAMSGWNGVAIATGSNTVSGLNISGNTIYNTRNGIVTHYNNSVTISGNTIYNTKGGIMNYTGSQADADHRVMSNNSWTSAHNEWDIVWNSGGGPYQPDYTQSVLALSDANNDAYVLSLMTTGNLSLLTGNRSHVFVNATTGTTTVHPANGNQNKPYATIQLGVDAVVPGGAVYVAAGAYAESPNIAKPLTFAGAQYDVDVSSRTAAGSGEASIQGLVTVNASDVNLNGFTLTNPGQTYALSITPSSSNVAVTYNIVDTVGAVGLAQNVHSIVFQNGADAVTIAHNLFNNIKASTKSASAIGVLDSLSANSSTGLQIQDNTFTDIVSGTKGAYGVILNNAAGVPNAVISGNTFSALSGGWTHAIGLEGPTPNVSVTDNVFSGLTAAGADNAAILFEKNPSGDTVAVSHNQFNGTGFYGVAVHPNDLPGGANGYTYIVNAENNWWNSDSGPGSVASGSGALVGPNVDYSPWCADAACATFAQEPSPLKVEVKDSQGDPIAGATIIYAVGSPNAGWQTFGITGVDGTVSRSDVTVGTTYHFYAQYNASTSLQQSVVYDGDDLVTFQTVSVKVKAETCPGVALQGAMVIYGSVNGGFLTFGTTGSDGLVSKELFPGYERTFYAHYNNTQSALQTVTVVGQIDPLVIFKTTALSLYSSGQILHGSANGGWYTFTKPTMEMFASTRTFKINGVEMPIEISGCSMSKAVNFLKLKDHSGQPLAGGTARGGYGSNFSTWHVAGSTDANGLLVELRDASSAPTSMSYEMTYNGTTQVKTQDVSINSVFEFQTSLVNMRLQTCDGGGLANGSVRYGIGSAYTTWWFPGGATNANGDTSAEFFPGTYSFEMQYQGTAESKLNVTLPASSPVVWNAAKVTLQYAGQISYGGAAGQGAWFTKPSTNLLPGGPYKFHFQSPEGGLLDLSWSSCNYTASVATVKLLNSAGAGIAGATAQYYDGGWKNIPGTTDAAGLLPVAIPGLKGNLTFAVNYGGARIQKSQNIAADSIVTFQTKAVTMKLLDSTGAVLAGGAEYYAGGWKAFGGGTTTASMELLPATYPFRVSYGGASLQKNQDVGANPNVEFATVPVTFTLLDSHDNPIVDAGADYYASGWKDFGATPATLELLPTTYPFRVTYLGASIQKNQNVADNPLVIFNTKAVTVKLLNAAGDADLTAEADFYASGWKDFGATPATLELLPTTYPFKVTYLGASIQKNQNVADDPNVKFQTKLVTVKLLNAAGDADLTAEADFYASGWKDLGTTPATLELLPTTYPFKVTYLGASIQKNQNVADNPLVIFNTKAVTVRLLNEAGDTDLTAEADFYAGGWKDFGATPATLELLPTTYPFRVTYLGASIQKNQDVAANPLVVFNTTSVAMKLLSSTAAELAGAGQFYASGWKDFGTTPATLELLPTTYPFKVTYLGASIQKNQNVADNPLVTFNTVAVTFKLLDSTGAELEGVAAYYASGWKDFGGGTTTEVAELLPTTYPFRVTYGGASIQKNQDVTAVDKREVIFNTTLVTMKLLDAAGAELAGGSQYYASGWKTFGGGTTTTTMQLLPTTYPFKVTYNGAGLQKNQDVSASPLVIFTGSKVTLQFSGNIEYYAGGWKTFTKPTTNLLPGTYPFRFSGTGFPAIQTNFVVGADEIVNSVAYLRLINSKENGIAGGSAQYYDGGWKPISEVTNSNGITLGFLPGLKSSITFKMNYAGAAVDKTQNIATNSFVVYQTAKVEVQLQNSAGLLDQLPAEGAAQYYASGWKDIGATVDGKVSIELLPLNYSFGMNYVGARQEFSQNVSTNPLVAFKTNLVEVQLQNSAGLLDQLPAEGAAQYYASGWKDIGATVDGEVSIELLPLNYSFGMNYVGARQEFSQNVSTNPLVVFKTGEVHSDSATCTQYYASGYKPFTQDMELLPASYAFTFTGFPQTNYTVVAGTTTHIH